jgi:hypothetical protein
VKPTDILDLTVTLPIGIAALVLGVRAWLRDRKAR